ncbi:MULTISPECIES: DUF1460 domain-containing protein [Pseudomonas syringae group]|uniref:DUF1460 domain-containing protein n=2 Tax=Pseudomonas syringae group TaxID=136849 RepID=A0AAW4E4R6_PSESX|nr:MULTISPECIES: DUF1460 domain-containing protein [Pseudomonas syringae group]AVI83619.1 hypothetical protein XJ28_07790 [Pseudomonas syringae pv. tomato]EEB60440.1 conserved hypothetical protein [Pseudomonas syringae pv. tomato T1]KGK95370.1 lipoprotein [Pseudomonas syringae pv. tomato]MBH0139825.1 DUF1460 domain-containing protein [Pseudomonas syringae pv. tomato]MBI6698059.1 DUF1460 domain-containing protein [Pseudomonas syringae]
MQKTTLLALALAMLAGCGVSGPAPGSDIQGVQAEMKTPIKVDLDAYTSKKLDAVLEARASKSYLDKGQLIDLVSGAFLGTPYRSNMLVGTANVPEQLVIDFRGLDCFAYLDYVEALRRSTSQQDFVRNLVQVRYKGGDVGFSNRKHFFTDWAYGTAYPVADDITAQISPGAVSVRKRLNERSKGNVYLPGLPVVERSMTYIPSRLVDSQVVSHLRTGDYIGIYTPLPGLDVTHVGFFIMTDKGPVLRNASSRKENRKVMDLPFLDYVSEKPGIVVFRAKDN